MRKSLSMLVVLAATVAALAVSGCGSSDDKDSSTSTPATTPSTTTSPQGGGGKLDIAADPSGALKFDKKSLTAKAGKVTIVMDNPSTVPHAVSIEGDGIDEEGTGGSTGVGKGETSTVSADLKPGKYEFYCPVDAHKQAGMEGTLTVK